MIDVYFGFKAFDLHELLCHFGALRAGLYEERNLNVRLIDTTFIPDDKLPANTFQAACGSALAAWINGAHVKVVFVATDHPLFWLYSKPKIDSLQDLKGLDIATYPAIAPPANFLRIILQRKGLAPETDVHLSPARDDIARLGLLSSGSVDAAVVSSAFPPAVVEKRGLKKLCMFGDELRVATTGIATTESMLTQQTGLVEAIVSAHKDALSLIHKDADSVSKVLINDFNIPQASLDDTYNVINRYFTQDGTSSVTEEGIVLMRELSQDSGDVPSIPLYDFSFLKAI